MNTRSITRRHTLACAAALLMVPTVWAQTGSYPSKPITFVVPFAAGSATDTLARALGSSVSEQTGQPVVIENKAGASGMIAAQAVARAPADGYTVIISTNTTHAANEHLFKRIAYERLLLDKITPEQCISQMDANMRSQHVFPIEETP